MEKPQLKLVISEKDILHKIKELANKIDNDFNEEPVVFIGTLKGAFMFLSDLVKHIKNPNVEVDFVRVKSYGLSDKSSGNVELVKDLELPVEGKNVIIVEDIVDTGLTLKFLYERIKELNPKTLKVCALINKKERREVDVPVDYIGFEVEKGFLVGYGLDFAERYRHLSEVYEVVKDE
ncbi:MULTISPECIES: hypoxanthine phosphoribosyltransferase [Thermodesulfobacterium]|jgi:hypoxanthine phosphoribosyltransferase|uniref:Hypoxanthine phosphoribosyltransferase n=1 Tax=Thermodesulfobacterium commune TaxID=1741 RepID=A0A117LCN3_9BACT|nr:hypoxanthine phosphoribosyltransferase [Thermodesulfobacterium sp.]KUJ98162.1 MAG: Hypoxanthine phosphoribosyltransferase [Thermodesulfobacterium sp. 37_54]KUK19808.1 MAG: Hypoxanthine phosphoribosyltransferase [Thermodesulfobacterium commune]KUK38651.1 MAG: Hypoxanthine phosphoribosyltransferase [Thermodesulfobacterium commune]MBZ4681928.1 hypoxanthine phosphoribosyltransferase [Thermodesulfobacterium sp.]MDN5379467.1 hypoxanthine phosphoribosyltransferase [Thermodesulfobacterium sp.]